MIVVAFEYNYINLDRNSICGILNITILEYNRKYGEDFRKVECKYNIKFFDKLRNRIENITTRRGVEKTVITSNERYEYIESNIFTIIIEGNISKNVLNTYMKCGNIPRLWIIFFLKIANSRDDVFNFCNRPLNNFNRHCREWYLYNNPNAIVIGTYTDELNNYEAYW